MTEHDPASLATPDRFKLLIGGIVPRPIAWVSTCDAEGRPNLAPFSFFNAIGAAPMMLLFCPANRPDGSEKDSLRNAKPRSEGGTGEFVVNIVSDAVAKAMALTAEALPYGESEFALAGVTPAPSRKVRAPRCAEAPISYECETVQVVRTAPGQPGGGNVVIGRVLWVWTAEGLVNERYHVDADRLDAVGRMGGQGYTRTRERFDLPQGLGGKGGGGG